MAIPARGFGVFVAGLLALLVVCRSLGAQSVATDTGTLDKNTAMAFRKAPYSPYAGRDFPNRPFFGDTHLHTSFSMDAGAFGCRISPA